MVAGSDWSRERNLDGAEAVVNRPFAFPLSPGKTSSVDYTELHPNKMFASQKWNSQYKVVGTDTVEVPAGKFQALKIESEGDWIAQIEQGDTAMITQAQNVGPVQSTGQTYKAFSHVPEIGRWVNNRPACEVSADGLAALLWLIRERG
ncbi:hypothetical protein P0D88_07115 [Paraburkholderia sp. RL18-103-BIB-C]|jgi:hypothetical protein|uniref:hypothetical protein n=1 Tax=unclassified Paraburkholderia TaxID=2615204 RepID=UPI002F6A59F2